LAHSKNKKCRSFTALKSFPGSYGSGYLSSKHLKRAIKYGSYYDHHMGGYGAPVVHSSVAAAPVIYGSHSGIYGSAYLSRKHLKRAIKYGSYYGAAPVVVEQKEVTENSAPVVHAPLFASRYHSKGGYHSTHHFHHRMGGYGAPVVHSSDAAAPVIYGSHSGIYGSAYLSRKHLKRAIKYGSYYGALAVVAYSPLTQGAYGAPFPQGSMVTVTT